ncbi:hypothetical protein DOT_0695 [Desulfosporosinus sp. OT]|nr:hypothetical protein DOT_0695 [Desulfosporosinus sp. OT]
MATTLAKASRRILETLLVGLKGRVETCRKEGGTCLDKPFVELIWGAGV